MNRPIRLGVLFSYREDWIGGSYYLLNLLSALKQLDERRRPEVIVFGASDSDLGPVRELDYPGASYRVLREPRPGHLLRLGNRVSGRVFGRPLVQPPAIEEALDVVYPAAVHPRYRKIPYPLFWIPDFQEEYLPDMFGPKRVENRRRVRGRVARLARHIVFSSQDAARDFRRFYPESAAEAHVLNFAVTHPELSGVAVDELRRRYRIGGQPFFMVSNQFWKHKNHEVVIEALHKIRAGTAHDEFLVCFSGKEEDSRNPGYGRKIRRLVERYDLQGQVRFLGFMDRADQLRLMQESVAVIQPSLFEGWSTVIEDAKALGVAVIASDLPVHAEQLGQDGTFFARQDALGLAEKMQHALQDGPNDAAAGTAYANCVRGFGEQFVAILEKIVKPDDAVNRAGPRQ